MIYYNGHIKQEKVFVKIPKKITRRIAKLAKELEDREKA
jgi:hypothetical protein